MGAAGICGALLAFCFDQLHGARSFVFGLDRWQYAASGHEPLMDVCTHCHVRPLGQCGPLLQNSQQQASSTQGF